MATLNIYWTLATSTPSGGYTVGYREEGSGAPYTLVSPNPTSSPVSISVPNNKVWEGYIASDCGTGPSTTVNWRARDPRSCNAYYNNSGSPINGINYTDCNTEIEYTNQTINGGESICVTSISGTDFAYLDSLGNCFDNPGT